MADRLNERTTRVSDVGHSPARYALFHQLAGSDSRAASAPAIALRFADQWLSGSRLSKHRLYGDGLVALSPQVIATQRLVTGPHASDFALSGAKRSLGLTPLK